MFNSTRVVQEWATSAICTNIQAIILKYITHFLSSASNTNSCYLKRFDILNVGTNETVQAHIYAPTIPNRQELRTNL